MTEEERFQAGECAWVVRPDHAAFVREVLLPAAADLAALPGAEVIKHNRIRTVVRAPGPAGDLYLKRFRAKGGLLERLKGAPAWREWAAMRAARAAGLLCPEPVVLGQEPGVGSVLATLALEGFEEVPRRLDALRADPGGGPARRALVEGLARACWGLLGAARVDHPDLHLANFLVAGDDRVAVLDLHSARVGAAPGAGRRRSRLGKLAHSFAPQELAKRRWAEEEIAWFAAAYAALDGAAGPAERLAEQLRLAARRQEEVRLRSRGKRCLVDSTGFAVQGPRGRRLYRRREVTAQSVWLALDRSAEAVVHAHPRGRSRIEVVAAPATLDEAGPRLIRKLYLFPRWRARLEGVFDPVPLRAWKAARALEVRGIPHPRHYALVLEGVIPRRGTVLMELIPDTTMIHYVLVEDPLPPPRSRRALARAVGELLGRFHASGLKHRDLSPQNVLIRPRGGRGEEGWEAWIIDLDEVRVGGMSRKERLRWLTQLADLPPAATRSDRLRFFRAYLAAGGDEVLAAELAAWGELGLGQRVGQRLAERARSRAERISRGIARPTPTDVSVLRADPGLAPEREGP